MRFRNAFIPFLAPIVVVAVSAATVGAVVPRLGDTTPITPPRPAPAADAKTKHAYAELPVAFERNQGQTDPRVSFVARGYDSTVFLTPSEAVMSFRGSAGRPAAVRMSVVGANPAAAPLGTVKLAGVANDLRGNDPTRWLTGIPTFGQVTYEKILPGTDLVFHSRRGQLEYDFMVAPGADPGAITVALRGADHLGLDTKGNLVLSTPAGTLRHDKPFIYQQIGAIRRAVTGGFVVKGADRIGFRLGAYDATRPLVIDPSVTYDFALGANAGTDLVRAVAVSDPGGTTNAFVTGETASTNFPTSAPSPATAYDTSFNDGDLDAFVTKLNNAGTATVYSTYLGGRGRDAGYGIAVTGTGSSAQAYVTGQTGSADFPTVGAYQSTCEGTTPAPLNTAPPCRNGTFSDGSSTTGSATYTSATAAFTAADVGRTITGANIPASTTISAVGSATTITLSANATATGSGLSFTIVERTSSSDAFVAKLKADGSGLDYSTYLGGHGSDAGYGIAVDGSGKAYLSGRVANQEGDFPTTPGAFTPVRACAVAPLCAYPTAFVAKIDPAAALPQLSLVYSTYLGQGHLGYTVAYGIAVDSSGNAFVAGGTSALSLPVPGTQVSDFPVTPTAFQPTNNGGGGDAFVTKFNATGSALLYSSFLGGDGEDYARGIALDASTPNASAYVVGTTGSGDATTSSAPFPVTSGAYQTTFGGGPASGLVTDGFVARIDQAGVAGITSLGNASYFGGADDDFGEAIAVVPGCSTSCSAYVTGSTGSTSSASSGLATTSTTSPFTATGNTFVARLTGNTLNYSLRLAKDAGYGIAVDSAGSPNAFLGGKNGNDGFVAKIAP